ncbi:hypothetical protein JL722_12716 [Aureococcus anophagefferens]|nr:hypothetical protein JL722_12716 [Aureococcus anophagefferens]
MASFAAGDWLWLDSAEDSWIPVRAVAAFKAGEAGQAEAEDGSAVSIDAKASSFCHLMDDQSLGELEDMTQFNDLSEGPLLHNLRKRYGKDGIYTWVGSILVAVNPFQVLPNCYTPENLARYRPSVGAGELSVEQQILQTNPVTEAFGNAKTLRNNNSSRFGKWTTLSFTPGGRITAAAITNYLESRRVSWQADGERGYHAFYQLLAHCHDDAALCADLRLGAAVCDDWRYVNMSSAHEVPGIDDKRDYDDVATALRALSFSDDEGLSVWKVVAGLLHVGNVAFAAGPKDEATVADAAPLETGSAVLGLDAAALREGLISKNIGTRSIIRTELSAAQADDARATPLHQLLQREKLQFHFNDHIFSQEAAEYTREGVDLAMVEFKNNGPTLELLEHKRSGVFAMLDEECVVPRGSDGGYLSKLFKAHEKHANFERCKPKEAQARTSFAVIHYGATDAVVASLFAADAKELGSGKKSKKVKTLGANFRGQLRDLVDALNACEPHFVRCIKPNSVKQPRVFTAPMVQSQMRCAGVLEVCKIRRAGFPFRSKFADFERRYHYIDVAAKGCPSLVAGLEKQRILLSGEWALGKTKACGRRYLARCRLCTWLRLTRKLAAAVASCDVEACEDALRDWYLLPHGGKHLAVYARGLAFKEESKALQAIIGECRSAMDRRDVAALDASVAKLKAAGNASLASVLEAAEALCHRLKHEPEVRAALVAAARAEDAAALKAALDEARAMGMAGPEVDAAARPRPRSRRADVVSQLRALAAAGGASAKELGALLRRAQELDAPAADVAGAGAAREPAEAARDRVVLSKPLETRRDGLAAALDGAAPASGGGGRFEAASKILARLDEELACVRDVEAAVAGDGDLGDRIAALAAALEGAEEVYHGTRRRLRGGEDAGQAEAYGKKVDRLAAAVEGLKKATAARDLDALNGAFPATSRVVRRELAARRDLAEAAERRDADLLTAALAAPRASARVVDAPECAVARRVADRLADEADAAGALAAAADARDADAAVAADVRAADEAERVAADEARAKADAERRRGRAARSTTPPRDDVDALDAALADAAAALVDGAALDRGRAARGPRSRGGPRGALDRSPATTSRR